MATGVDQEVELVEHAKRVPTSNTKSESKTESHEVSYQVASKSLTLLVEGCAGATTTLGQQPVFNL